MFDNKLIGETAQKVYPFSTMYDEELHKEAKVPRSPILISKGSTKFYFKLPFFKPKIPELLVLENPNRAIISSMAIYGKKGQNTDVSATSTELSNCGIRYQCNDVISIPHLVPNEKYCFAVAAFDAEENICNDIGITGEKIHAALPLPVNLLYNYLARIAFQLSDFDTAQKAASKGCGYFIQRSFNKEKTLNWEDNPTTYYRINTMFMKETSYIELQSASESFLVWALCLEEETEKRKNLKSKILPITYQRALLKTCNILCLG